MFAKDKEGEDFFDLLCQDHYPRVLRYLHRVLGDEFVARDCTQEVFLVALQKRALLRHHPNPGGFLLQTAKNLAKKARRESLRRALSGELDALEREPADHQGGVLQTLDRQINEEDYVELVLATLGAEKRRLYDLYYLGGRTMAEIAAMLGVEEPALRMRYVRLRRELRVAAAQVAEKFFPS